MDTVKVIQLIKTTLTRRGNGTDSDPVRIITEYWTMDGKKEFEIDPCVKELVHGKDAMKHLGDVAWCECPCHTSISDGKCSKCWK